MEFRAHLEEVKPLIRQKGDLIKITMTVPFSTELWGETGPMIGKTVGVRMAALTEAQIEAMETGQVGLPFEGDGEA